MRLVISGRVQGVGYRAWFMDEARARTLTGWVRNRRDGAVEAIIAGEGKDVEVMIEASRKGPWGARVTSIEQAGAGDEGWADLSIRQTG
ncbi:acylphosphatase [soil metagenome]